MDQANERRIVIMGAGGRDFHTFLTTMKESSEMMSTYRDQMNVLTERVSALNKVYGGMLTAMNPGS